MSKTFHYAALGYLNQWLGFDRKARQVLGHDGSGSTGQAVEQLLEVAKYYGVARNFGLKYEKGGLRFEKVWYALKAIEQPATDEGAKACLEKLVDELRVYGRDVCSAASKFLWMRFGKPIIIYDKLAVDWMHKFGNLSGDRYAAYYDGWRCNFKRHKEKIGEACQALHGAKDFVNPPGVTECELQSLVSEEWFMERVFDYFMSDKALNDPSALRRDEMQDHGVDSPF